jgi:hypothetical protein
VCKVCDQKSALLEINRHLRPDLQDFFKDPKDLLSQFQQKLNKVYEFQSGQRKRIMKNYQDQVNNRIMIIVMCVSCNFVMHSR